MTCPSLSQVSAIPHLSPAQSHACLDRTVCKPQRACIRAHRATVEQEAPVLKSHHACAEKTATQVNPSPAALHQRSTNAVLDTRPCPDSHSYTGHATSRPGSWTARAGTLALATPRETGSMRGKGGRAKRGKGGRGNLEATLGRPPGRLAANRRRSICHGADVQRVTAQ